ncbi:hypothetical protein Glove_291g34 [Diversispora epigaea]|uniref:Uncharacterized protein n=1 Tax=Diversispora epigaea TaxID=1348612 RepID=A0A397I1D2_9GLOM|nr:hypothetical protein Glove_291g34 [Diversispora epigaea]
MYTSSVNFFKRKPSKSFTPITFEYLQHKRNIYEGKVTSLTTKAKPRPNIKDHDQVYDQRPKQDHDQAPKQVHNQNTKTSSRPKTNCNKEITLPSNDETTLLSINDKTQPNNNNNNETILPDNSIPLENSISNITNSLLLQQAIVVPFVGQVFEIWDDVDKYLHEYAWQEKFVIIKTRNDRGPPPEQISAIINITSLNINHNHPLNPITNTYATKN